MSQFFDSGGRSIGVSVSTSVLPMDIQSVHPKGGQFWVFVERTDVETETPILRPPDVKS